MCVHACIKNLLLCLCMCKIYVTVIWHWFKCLLLISIKAFFKVKIKFCRFFLIIYFSFWYMYNKVFIQNFLSFQDCMSSLLDLILEGSSSDSPTDLVTQFQDLNRSAVLITETELLSLVRKI